MQKEFDWIVNIDKKKLKIWIQPSWNNMNQLSK